MTEATLTNTTPMMLQWQSCKQAAGDAVLFFRMGDFYEAFYEDAILVARELELTLTKRQEVPMSGVPHHSSEGYIDRLVSKGYRVAVAEQTEDPKAAKGLVKREVVRVVTPGTLINSSLLSDKSNNFFVSITQVGATFGLAVLDLTTADCRVSEFENVQELFNEIYRYNPAEILTSHKFQERHAASFTEVKQAFTCLITPQDDWRFDHQIAHDFLITHFKVHSLDGFGLKGKTAGINAGGALLQYLHECLCLPIDHIQEIRGYSTTQYMSLDRNTQRHLELTEPLHEGGKQNTLLGLLDCTKTSMGARLLRQWIKQPLLSLSEISERQDAVETFVNASPVLDQLKVQLEGVRDMERLIMRISAGYASPRDLVALKDSFEPIQRIKVMLQPLTEKAALIRTDETQLDSLPEMTSLIARALVDEPPMRITDGKIFRFGYCRELDELRTLCQDSQTWIANYQTQLRDQTGIKTMKVGFNRAFGYYIEVSKGQADRMPDHFQRRQTLTNAERFITPELKEYESKVLTAEERIAAMENELFQTLRQEVAKYATAVIAVARALARLDSFHSLAQVARRHRYVRPLVDQSAQLHITEGRHPVIEACLGEAFVSNDTQLDDQDNRLLVITGPNMAGKSTYIRQVALIAIMAQIGSFIPAKAAHLGVIDKVFTRIGASDDLARGQSTFMVEMNETANILNNATSQSLVILDEIGRGTSTYDGISIAWAVAEHLLLTTQAKTLFATHYWELTKLEGKIPGAVNYNVAVHESADNIVFLRKIIRGGTDKSYGIHVARLAGLPVTVIARAKELLTHLEENANRKSAFEPSRPKRQPPKIKSTQELQLTFFEPSSL